MSHPNPKSTYITRRSASPDSSSSDISDSELLEGLEDAEDGFDMVGYRERRLEAIKSELQVNRDMRESDHGRYTEIMNEKEVVQTTAKEPLAVVHFYHRDFKRCEIMHRHLETLAPRHFRTRFIKVFVENAPWLVEKLGIKVLPCVICFIGGYAKDRIIGFEDLGNSDAFGTEVLEWRLIQAGAIEKPNASGPSSILGFPSAKSSGSRIRDGDVDSDMDD